ncbi:MAG: hypothetical protein R2851_20790 [Caldilineaceae bacterium]
MLKKFTPAAQGDVDQAGCLFSLGRAPGLENGVVPPKVAVPKLSTGTLRPEPPSSR